MWVCLQKQYEREIYWLTSFVRREDEWNENRLIFNWLMPGWSFHAEALMLIKKKTIKKVFSQSRKSWSATLSVHQWLLDLQHICIDHSVVCWLPLTGLIISHHCKRKHFVYAATHRKSACKWNSSEIQLSILIFWFRACTVPVASKITFSWKPSVHKPE